MRDPRGAHPDLEPPQTAQEALRRARDHARNALSEALLAARSLLDASALGLSGRPIDDASALRPLVDLLEQTSRSLATEDRMAGPLVGAILDALDHEIRRWEERAHEDAEARAVLRAFLGVREILWEFGLRRGQGDPTTPSPEADPETGSAAGKRAEPAGRKPRARRSRVERVRVQG